MPLRLHNTLTRSVEPFVPGDPARVTFYSCGPTVYDDAHIGNFRSFLAADVLRRFVQSSLCAVTRRDGSAHQGPRTVTHVMNITDVGHMTDDAEGGEHGEDRMAVAGRRLLEAKKSGQLHADTQINPADPYAIAEFYAQRFLDDARKLGLLVAIEAQQDPSLMPRPTQKVPQMVAMIQTLIERGHAYAVGPAGMQVVYFSVESFPAYGKLSGNTLEKLRSGAGGRIDEGNQQQKRHPADFLLWKADPSHIMKWDSLWGAGYPGWHIECSAMAGERLADSSGAIDLHSGGEDNIFPHHECEVAQTCGCTGNETYARMWFHPRFLIVEGAKMSKSKGNFFTARDLFAKGIEPGALRLELIRTHYRSNANFTMQGLEDSKRMLDRWRKVAAAAGAEQKHPHLASQSPGHPLPAELKEGVLGDFAAAMHNDLNVAEAIGVVNAWINTLGAPSAADGAAMGLIDGVLGVLSLARAESTATGLAVYAPGVTPSEAVEAKLAERKAARAAKDFAASDRLRDELAAMGYAIKDVTGGKVEVSRKG
ncbi:MAG: cysteine--tRNA ligase [Phycisphaerales bacterium]|nr:cysteine--tRNA ligase [Phycisphaerales bacterium]